MSSRMAGILAILISIPLMILSGDATAFVLALFIGGAAIIPNREEAETIHELLKLLKAHYRMSCNVCRLHRRNTKAGRSKRKAQYVQPQ